MAPKVKFERGGGVASLSSPCQNNDVLGLRNERQISILTTSEERRKERKKRKIYLFGLLILN